MSVSALELSQLAVCSMGSPDTWTPPTRPSTDHNPPAAGTCDSVWRSLVECQWFKGPQVLIKQRLASRARESLAQTNAEAESALLRRRSPHAASRAARPLCPAGGRAWSLLVLSHHKRASRSVQSPRSSLISRRLEATVCLGPLKACAGRVLVNIPSLPKSPFPGTPWSPSSPAPIVFLLVVSLLLYCQGQTVRGVCANIRACLSEFLHPISCVIYCIHHDLNVPPPPLQLPPCL